MKTVSCLEIATVTGRTKSSIGRRLANHSKYPFIWKSGPKGKEKHFYIEHLPEKIRIDLARNEAAPVQAISRSVTGSAGAAAAEKMLQDKAEEAERIRSNKTKGLAMFETLPDKNKLEAYGRYDFLMACDGFVAGAGCKKRKNAKRSKIGDKLFIEAYNKGMVGLDESVIKIIGVSSSESTIRRISDAYNEQGLYGLAFKYRNPSKGTTSVSATIQDFIKGVIFKKPHAKIKWIMKMIRVQFSGEKIPSYDAVRRFIGIFEEENKNLLLSITNPDEFKNRVMSAMGNASENVVRLNQLWELDSTPGDVMLTDGRHNIVGIIEVFSRRMRLLVSPSSSSAAVAALIRRCLLEWGVPEVAKLDNGKDYISDHVQRILTGLDIYPDILPPFCPEKKPHIERGLGTFSHGIVEYLPGFIGHNVAERKALEARKSFSQRLGKKGEVIKVEMSSAELQDICDSWIDAMYLHEPHGGLNGATPMDVVRRWPEPVRMIEDERALDMLLAPAPRDGGLRTIQKKGVKVNGAWYTAVELMGEERENKTVKVLLDHMDFGVIRVYLVHDNHLEFLCKAHCKDREGVNQQEVAAIGRAKQSKYYSKQRKILKKLSKQVGNAAEAKEILRQREGEVRNIVEFPKVIESFMSKGLQEATRAVEADEAVDPLKAPTILTAEEEAIAEDMLNQPEYDPIEQVIDARGLFEEKKVNDAEKSDWQSFDGFERYEFLIALPAMTMSQKKWVEYFKTTSEYEALQDIYEAKSL